MAWYYLKEEQIQLGGGEVAVIASAYTVDGDHYVGDPDFARMLDQRGIVAAPPPQGRDICCIGFNETEQKWYGWSHRAMHGFSIGSTVREGDIGYQAASQEAWERNLRKFWADEFTAAVNTAPSRHEERPGVWLIRTFNDLCPNTNARGELRESFHPFPEQWGRGEWTAKTLDDARQMAIDYANDIA